jgi:hypothetical protein
MFEMAEWVSVPQLDLVETETLIEVSGCPTLRLAFSQALHHDGDCALIGVDAHRGRVAIEEYYDDWLAQYAFNADGTLIAVSDEETGMNPTPEPLPDVDLYIAPPPVGNAAALNYTGGRWRGLREEDRVSEMARPLTIGEKLALKRFGIPTPILGLAESYVLAEARITGHWSVIVRRVRVAFAVPRSEDEEGESFDYDSLPIYLAQWFNNSGDITEAPLDQRVIALGTRPMDAQYDPVHNRLYIADGGEIPRSGALYAYSVS